LPEYPCQFYNHLRTTPISGFKIWVRPGFKVKNKIMCECVDVCVKLAHVIHMYSSKIFLYRYFERLNWTKSKIHFHLISKVFVRVEISRSEKEFCRIRMNRNFFSANRNCQRTNVIVSPEPVLVIWKSNSGMSTSNWDMWMQC